MTSLKGRGSQGKSYWLVSIEVFVLESENLVLLSQIRFTLSIGGNMTKQCMHVKYDK